MLKLKKIDVSQNINAIEEELKNNRDLLVEDKMSYDEYSERLKELINKKYEIRGIEPSESGVVFGTFMTIAASIVAVLTGGYIIANFPAVLATAAVALTAIGLCWLIGTGVMMMVRVFIRTKNFYEAKKKGYL